MGEDERIGAAVRSGDRKEILRALQDKLAETIDSSNSGMGVAALANQLMKVTEELENLQEEQEKPKEELKTVLQIVRSKHRAEA